MHKWMDPSLGTCFTFNSAMNSTKAAHKVGDIGDNYGEFVQYFFNLIIFYMKLTVLLSFLFLRFSCEFAYATRGISALDQ